MGIAAASPVFDKCTEEGVRFRIYRFGSLEVRTTQQPDCECAEEVGEVFSVSNTSLSSSVECHIIPGDEKVLKTTEYVERAFGSDQGQSKIHCRYFLVLDTENGHKIILHRDRGATTWVENPQNLQGRIAVAKIMRTSEAGTGITIEHMKIFEAESLSNKRFSHAAFLRVAGKFPC